MPSQNAKALPSSLFAALTMKMVLDNPLPDETPSHRVKQIGLLSIMYYMMSNDIPTTAPNIVKHTGLSRTTLNLVVKPLFTRDMLSDLYEPTSKTGGPIRCFVFSESLIAKIAALAEHVGESGTKEADKTT